MGTNFLERCVGADHKTLIRAESERRASHTAAQQRPAARQTHTSLADRLFGVFGTPNFIGPDMSAHGVRLFGSKHTYGVSTPRPDTENANCILLWGINPQASDPVSAKWIAKCAARERNRSS